VKILAIRFARLGDVILLLPALNSLKQRFPDSELTLLTGHRCAPIAELCPAIDRVISVDRVAMRDGPVLKALWKIGGVVRQVRREHFDTVIDFHSFRETNLLSWLSDAPLRIGMKRHDAPFLRFCFNTPPVVEDKLLHVSEMFQKVVSSIPPQTDFRANPASPWGQLAVEKASVPTIALYIDAPVPSRIWPPERFAKVADFANERLGAAVIVICSHERRDLARRVQETCRQSNGLMIFSDLTLPALARVIGSAHLLVSNDTGPMHLGPAVGVPTLGLFSVGLPEHFRPIGPTDRFLKANPIEGLEVGQVTSEMERMWTTVGPNLRR
jgi:ADP-heptose:LPS heptosyltransferase